MLLRGDGRANRVPRSMARFGMSAQKLFRRWL